MASAAGGSWHRILIWMCQPQSWSGVHEMRECANPWVCSALSSLLLISSSCPFLSHLWTFLGQSSWHERLPGKDSHRPSGFHMKGSCLERASPLWPRVWGRL